MGKVKGAIVGAAIDRHRGGLGIKGALIGAGVEGAIRMLPTVAEACAIGFAARYGIKKIRGWLLHG